MSQNIIQSAAAEVGKWAPVRIMDLEDQIKEAINVLTEENQGLEEPKALVVNVPISVKINLDENTVEITAAVSVKYKAGDKIKLEDPNQPELIDRNGDPLPDSVAKPLKAMSRVMRENGASISFSIPGDKKTTEMLRRAADELSGKEGGAK